MFFTPHFSELFSDCARALQELCKVIDVALYLIKNPESPPWLARGIIIHHDEFPLRPSSSEI